MGGTLADKNDVTELNDNILNSMTNRWSKQTYGQGFDCKYTSFNKYVNMFECMEISEYIYKGEVEPYYRNLPEKWQLCWSQ